MKCIVLLSCTALLLSSCTQMPSDVGVLKHNSGNTGNATYTVTYDGNGSTGGSVPSAQTKTQGVALTLASNTGSLVKSGYTFAGWNTTTGGSGTDYAVGASYTADANMALYAKWTQTSGTPGPDVTDTDGNVYQTVTIGTQVWMAENLKTTKYNDGSPIPLVTDSAAWVTLPTPGYCWYNNDAATYKSTYGALYNWYAVNTGKLAPTGWHVPTDAEWRTLTTFFGGESVAGGKLKEAGATHWNSPNTGATNSSGFSGLPGGSRYFNGTFISVGNFEYWWSSSAFDATSAWFRGVYYDNATVNRYYNDCTYGFSVRCVKD